MSCPTCKTSKPPPRWSTARLQATPQYRWATLSQRLGTDCWVKHENHTPVGAFKIRGGLTYFDQLRQRGECRAR
jgi:threonine dehydratase